jgi:hypothetical protein
MQQQAVAAASNLGSSPPSVGAYFKLLQRSKGGMFANGMRNEAKEKARKIIVQQTFNFYTNLEEGEKVLAQKNTVNGLKSIFEEELGAKRR